MNMARIAYIDHSFHQKTVSNKFVPDALQAAGHEVDLFWDEGWCGGAGVAWSAVEHHDVVVMFQSFCDTQGRPFGQLHKNVVYIPMLDQFSIWIGQRPAMTPFWELFQGAKVLNFSSALHAMTLAAGLDSHYARFYPEPLPQPPPTSTGLHGFFWVRRNDDISWPLIKQLLGATRFDSFHLHLVPDPGTPPASLPTEEDIRQFNITTSTWFDDKAAFEAVLAKANVFFAPRLGEGIGQSFLEAMNRGQCVVAANQGTMNEYILHGLNGLLYNHLKPAPLDFRHAHQLGAAGRASLVEGRQTWLSALPEVVAFITEQKVAEQEAEANTTQQPRGHLRRMLTRWRK